MEYCSGLAAGLLDWTTGASDSIVFPLHGDVIKNKEVGRRRLSV